MTFSDVRLRPSAAIIRDGAILLIECDEPGFGVHYNLPGGGLLPEETVYDGLRRELREEAGVEIEIGPLLMVWELALERFKPHHHVGLVFRCALADGMEPHVPEPADEFQIGVVWVPLDDLPGIRLLPAVVPGKLMKVLGTSNGVDPFVVEDW